MATFLDLSHTVEDGLVTYQGLPAPIVGDFMTRKESRGLYAPGTTFHIGKIDMVANTGTYIDAPSHRFAEGKDLSELPLEKVANLEGIVIRSASRERRAIGVEFFANRSLAGSYNPCYCCTNLRQKAAGDCSQPWQDSDRI